MKHVIFLIALTIAVSAHAQSRNCKPAATGAIESQVRMGQMHGDIEAVHPVTKGQREQVAQALQKARGNSGVSPAKKQTIVALLRSNDDSKKFFVVNMNSFGKEYSVLVVNAAASCAPEGIYPLN